MTMMTMTMTMTMEATHNMLLQFSRSCCHRWHGRLPRVVGQFDHYLVRIADSYH